MSKPLVVSIPHRLGKREALRRLKTGLGSVGTDFGHLFIVEETIWTSDRVQFRLSALGTARQRQHRRRRGTRAPGSVFAGVVGDVSPNCYSRRFDANALCCWKRNEEIGSQVVFLPHGRPQLYREMKRGINLRQGTCGPAAGSVLQLAGRKNRGATNARFIRRQNVARRGLVCRHRPVRRRRLNPWRTGHRGADRGLWHDLRHSRPCHSPAIAPVTRSIGRTNAARLVGQHPKSSAAGADFSALPAGER